jgi:hypothetical protein
MSPLSALILMSLFVAPPVRTEEPTSIALVDELGTVIVSAQEIVSYDSAHRMILVPGVKSRLLRERASVSGCRFRLLVQGQCCYEGVMTLSLSSNSFNGVVIDLFVGSADELVFQIGYPTKDHFRGDDPRGDARIKAALDKLGKWK